MNSVASGDALDARVAERLRSHLPSLVLGALLLLGAALYYIAGRGLSFFYDEWTFILYRRSNHLSSFLEPHNGHLSLIPVLIYKALWATVGLRHYGPYRLVDVALHLTCVVLLYVLVRRHAGPWLALIAAASLLFLGSAWQDLVWPFQIGYLGSLAGGLGAFVALGSRPRRDAIAALLLAFSLACSGLGITFLAGALVALLLRWSGWRSLWVVAGPTALYGLWYAFYGRDVASLSNVPDVPAYVYESLAGALGALSGLGYGAGKVLAVLALVGAIAAIVRRRPLTWAAAPAVAVLSFWGLAAIARAQYREPAASRYLYPGALLLLLVAAGLIRGMRVPRGVIALLGLVVVGTSLLNLRTLRSGADGLRANDVTVNAELAIVELERSVVPPDFQPDPERAPQITAGRYLAAIRELGSPALPATALTQQPPFLRADADEVLMRAVRPVLLVRGGKAADGPPPHVDGYGAGSLSRSGGCVTFRPARSTGVVPSLDVVVPASGLVVRVDRPASVFARRFANAYPDQVSIKLATGTSEIHPPKDALPSLPWRVRIAPEGLTSVCTAA